jgi:hypothetical protein
MLGEDLFDLNEQAARWQWMTEQVRDKRALDALAKMLEGVEKQIASVEAAILQDV